MGNGIKKRGAAEFESGIPQIETSVYMLQCGCDVVYVDKDLLLSSRSVWNRG